MISLLAFLVSAWGDCNCSGLNREPLVVTLEVVANEASVTGTLVFRNVSSGPVHLNKVNACLGDRIDNNVFVVRSGDVSLEYMLPRIKRLSKGMDDYYRLNPGESVQTKLNLGDAYQFLDGEHEYSVRYMGIHGAPQAGEKLFEVTSNEVKFKHKQSQAVAPDNSNP